MTCLQRRRLFSGLAAGVSAPGCACGTGQLAPNKKWAVGPLTSPPAGKPTATMADKFVCMVIIRPFAREFNHPRHLRWGRRRFAVQLLSMPLPPIRRFERAWLQTCHPRRPDGSRGLQCLPKTDREGKKCQGMASAMPPAPKIDVGFSPEGSPSSSNAISEQGGVSNVYNRYTRYGFTSRRTYEDGE